MSIIGPFRGKYFFLSNFYPAAVYYEQITYPTAEHAFAAAKALDMGLRSQIASLPKPGQAARAGRKLPLRPGWDQGVKDQVMLEILRIKFSDPALKKLLLSTSDADLVEYNTWHDTYWGVCTCNIHNGFGKNQLGVLLGKTRQRFIDQSATKLPPKASSAEQRSVPGFEIN